MPPVIGGAEGAEEVAAARVGNCGGCMLGAKRLSSVSSALPCGGVRRGTKRRPSAPSALLREG
eukprot:4268569-Pyramimonas_sp.AAC.1